VSKRECGWSRAAYGDVGVKGIIDLLNGGTRERATRALGIPRNERDTVAEAVEVTDRIYDHLGRQRW